MAIYSLEVTAFSRSKGEAMIPKAAYRAGSFLVDRRTGLGSDYRRRRGVEAAFMIFPHGLVMSREAAWNAVEARERRRDACVGREVRFALPAELSAAGRDRCARRLATHLVEQDDVFVDVAIHSANPAGDQRNWHTHLCLPTRKMDADGNLTSKLRHWDDPRLGPKTIKALRQLWAEIANEELALEGDVGVSIDARSNRGRGIDARPGVKLGLAATAIERRTGSPSNKRIHSEAPIAIDFEVVAAMRAFEAAIAARRDPEQPPQAAASEPSIDVDAILTRLRDGARQQIKRHFQALRKDNRLAGEMSAVTDRMPRPLPRTAGFARRRTAPLVPTHNVTRKKSPHSFSSVPPKTSALRNVPNSPIPAREEALDLIVWRRALAFAIAAAEVAGEATSDEISTFVRRAINVVARDLGLPPSMIEAEVASYRTLSKPFFQKILASVRVQCQRLVELIGAAIAATSLGYPSSVRPRDASGAQTISDAKIVLSAVSEADRLRNGISSGADTEASSVSPIPNAQAPGQIALRYTTVAPPPMATNPLGFMALSQFEKRSGHYHDAEIEIAFGQIEPAVKTRDDPQSKTAVPSVEAKPAATPVYETERGNHVEESRGATPRPNADDINTGQHDKPKAVRPNHDVDSGPPSKRDPSQQRAESASDIADPKATSTAKDDQAPGRNPSSAPKPKPPKRGGWER